jgi:hypothetical protein
MSYDIFITGMEPEAGEYKNLIALPILKIV